MMIPQDTSSDYTGYVLLLTAAAHSIIRFISHEFIASTFIKMASFNTLVAALTTETS